MNPVTNTGTNKHEGNAFMNKLLQRSTRSVKSRTVNIHSLHQTQTETELTNNNRITNLLAVGCFSYIYTYIIWTDMGDG